MLREVEQRQEPPRPERRHRRGEEQRAGELAVDLYVTDVVLGDLLRVGSGGGTTVFAGGFSGNDDPPAIGPNGIAYDGPDKMYVADGDSIFLISRRR